MKCSSIVRACPRQRRVLFPARWIIRTTPSSVWNATSPSKTTTSTTTGATLTRRMTMTTRKRERKSLRMRKQSRWSITLVRRGNLSSTTNPSDHRFRRDFRPALRLHPAVSKRKSGSKSHPKLHPAGVALPLNPDPI